jgi:ATP-dependent Clp protease ATP-binding subunit ClpA
MIDRAFRDRPEGSFRFMATKDIQKDRKDILDRWVETDLAAEAAAGRLGRAYGREELLAAMEEVYVAGRSPVLVGEAGVGKTALVHELVVRAAVGRGRVRLDGARVLQVSLRRGASTVGREEAVGRYALELADVLVELGDAVVVYVRDLHLALGLDLEEHVAALVSRLARPLLGEGEPQAMRSLIEDEPQLEQHCTLVEVGEPTLAETRHIVERWVEQTERAQAARGGTLHIRPDAVEASLQLSHRFLVRSHLPRKAMAPLEQLAAVAAAEPAGVDAAAVSPADRRGTRRGEVSERDVVSLFCRQYGLPPLLVDPRQRLDLARLSRNFGEQVLGQPRAVAVAVSLLARIKAGLLDPQRPLGVFLFVGPSGVGKTLLARRIAERALGSAERMIRLNMADYPEDADGQLLFGNPTAYVPAQRQGLLTRRILGCQFGVLLLDELEKASPKVHDRFLQLVDEGSFINGAGQQIPCRSLVVIATSNAGSGLWRDERPGFLDDAATAVAPADDVEQVEARLRRFFRFELLNRFDEIVPFAPLERHHVRTLVRRLLGELERRPGLARLDLRLEVSDEAIEWLLDRGFDPRNGVRFLRRTVEREVGTRLAAVLVREAVGSGDVLLLEIEGADLQVRVVAPAVVLSEVVLR